MVSIEAIKDMKRLSDAAAKRSKYFADASSVAHKSLINLFHEYRKNCIYYIDDGRFKCSDPGNSKRHCVIYCCTKIN